MTRLLSRPWASVRALKAENKLQTCKPDPVTVLRRSLPLAVWWYRAPSNSMRSGLAMAGVKKSSLSRGRNLTPLARACNGRPDPHAMTEYWPGGN